MVKEVKRGSSLWLKTKRSDLHDFSWQNGYGMFSIGFSQIEAVRNSPSPDRRIITEKFHFRMNFANCRNDMRSNLTNVIYGIDSTHSGLRILAERDPG